MLGQDPLAFLAVSLPEGMLKYEAYHKTGVLKYFSCATAKATFVFFQHFSSDLLISSSSFDCFT